MAELESEPAALAIEESTDGSGAPVISLSGDLDISNVQELDAALASIAAAQPERVIIDLSRLRFMDSAGIAVLLRIAERGPTLQVRNPSAAVQRVIELTGLTAVLGLEP